MSSGNEFEQGDAGANLTYPLAGGSVKKNSHMMIKGKPCKVTEVSVSKTGKHGHAKAHVFGLDIFTGKKYEDVFPTSHNVDAPFVKKFEANLVYIEEGFASYMDEEGNVQEIALPDEEDEDFVADLIAASDEEKEISINVIEAMGQQKVVGFRLTKG